LHPACSNAYGISNAALLFLPVGQDFGIWKRILIMNEQLNYTLITNNIKGKGAKHEEMFN